MSNGHYSDALGDHAEWVDANIGHHPRWRYDAASREYVLGCSGSSCRVPEARVTEDRIERHVVRHDQVDELVESLLVAWCAWHGRTTRRTWRLRNKLPTDPYA